MSGNHIRGLGVLAGKYPITLFQAVVFAFHHEPRDYSALLLVLAFLLDRWVVRLAIVDRWLSELWKVSRFVRKHSACDFAHVDLASVVTSDFMRRYRTRFMSGRQIRTEERLRSLLRLEPFDAQLRQRTRIYVVRRNNAREMPCPTAFATDLGGFIFVTESPKDIVGLQRFFLLHELGHLCPRSKYTTLRARLVSTPFFFLHVWAFPQMIYPRYSFSAFLVWALLGFAIAMFRDGYWYFMRKAGDGFDEMAADLFALENLSRRELVTVASFYQRWPIPADRSLFPQVDEARRELLRENLNRVYETKGKNRTWRELAHPMRMEWPVWVCFALAAICVPFANPATDEVMVVEGLIAVGSMNLFWIYRVFARGLEKWIVDVLAVEASTRADLVERWPKEPSWQQWLRIRLGYETFETERFKEFIASDLVYGIAEYATVAAILLLILVAFALGRAE